jgi:hypothetical protein
MHPGAGDEGRACSLGCDRGGASLAASAAAGAPPRGRAKKSPAVRRGKTDSLEISQRGKTRIYTKFMMQRKRKKKKNRTLSNVKYAEISSSSGKIAKRDVMSHNFYVSR